MSRTSISLSVVVLAAFLAGSLTGCQPKVATPADIGVSAPSGSVPASATASAPKVLPAGLPSDFPVFKGTVVASAKSTARGVTTFSFSIETAQPPSTVSYWYRSHLDSAGWKVASGYTKPQAGGSFTVLVLTKGTSKANVAIGNAGRVTRVICTLAVKG